MEEEAVAEVLVCSIIATSCIEYNKSFNTQRRKRKQWVKDYFRERDRYGAYNLILQELRLKDPYAFRRYLRMNTNVYEVGLKLVLYPLYVHFSENCNC